MSSASTEFDVPSVLAETARPERVSSGLQDFDVEPAPPQKLEFTCSCGTRLLATTETYDKYTRCAMCQTVMVLSLVYDPERKGHEIIPFRVNPDQAH